MPVNSSHPDFDFTLPAWKRARDVIAGEDAVKLGCEKYLPRLDSQSDDEYKAYKTRASFFNATSRTADGYVGLIFRRVPALKLPESLRTATSGLANALSAFAEDADMLGTSLEAYAKNVTNEVICVGRAGTLVDWNEEVEQRAYAVAYTAEQIINWQTERVNGRNVLTLLVLKEVLSDGHLAEGKKDEFTIEPVEQIRVLKLTNVGSEWQYNVEVWQLLKGDGSNQTDNVSGAGKKAWLLVDTRVPLRLGKPLPLIPFVFQGPRHSLPDVDKLPLADIIFINLDHYRLNADYKHGLHYTALPTAYLTGFDKEVTFKIGSPTAWVTDTPNATAGFLEFKGEGLKTFERAMDRDEQLMAVLGSRMLEAQKRVGETADAIELRQSGEASVLSGVSICISESLTQVLRWVYWWNSTEPTPEAIGEDVVLIKLNTDFSVKGMTAQQITAIVAAWQANAISQETMFELFRTGEVLPPGRSNEEEAKLVESRASRVESRTNGAPINTNGNGGHGVTRPT